VKKGTALQPQLAFPARAAEVRRFGVAARWVVRAKQKLSDSKSFVKVVKEGVINHDQGKRPTDMARDQPGAREDEFILHFPSQELRDELTKFKGFVFATAPIKAKVEPTEMEKEVVSLLEENWVKATRFPSKANKAEVIKEVLSSGG
jgi:hypothetical protein